MATDAVLRPAEVENGPKQRSAKISLSALVALVIGSMIGGGIFGLPSQMAAVAAPGPLIIGWVITGFGMLMLAKVYQTLAVKRPDIEAGIYGYAKEGFGSYIGFSSAWGYWVSAWMGNVGYLVLLMSAVGVFLPGFGEGNTTLAITVASVILWSYHALILRGIHEASVINTIVTIAKIVPLIVFAIIAVVAFDFGVFSADFWGQSTDLGSALEQIKAMMLVTVWVFIGVEGASVFSERAKNRTDVGRATIIGFASVLTLLLLINLLSYGVVARDRLAEIPDPSLSGVLTAVVGPWGAKFIAAGLIITLIGSLLAWFLMCAEILRVPAQDGTLPAWLGRENKHSTPVGAMWLTTSMVQLMLLWAGFGGAGYTDLILLASALILLPYVFSAVFHLVGSLRSSSRIEYSEVAVGALASVYSIWLLYAAGPKYLLFVGLFYLPGTPFYIAARRRTGEKVFTPVETGILIVLVIASAYAIYGLTTGTLAI
ncbi:arginine-ornithine antiporter [Actinomyces sp.]|uniref:arginine-ornithine antiporter n=1 Tax=Actinomyces sp. TaxID=29317 RepID=UPI0026DD4A74|nr:arginine-ornithine antiporter [Actinomyces sp.]MDO4900471.1 arginine-ornithine antiporter [Actinomyces sp.]